MSTKSALLYFALIRISEYKRDVRWGKPWVERCYALQQEATKCCHTVLAAIRPPCVFYRSSFYRTALLLRLLSRCPTPFFLAQSIFHFGCPGRSGMAPADFTVLFNLPKFWWRQNPAWAPLTDIHSPIQNPIHSNPIQYITFFISSFLLLNISAMWKTNTAIGGHRNKHIMDLVN